MAARSLNPSGAKSREEKTLPPDATTSSSDVRVSVEYTVCPVARCSTVKLSAPVMLPLPASTSTSSLLLFAANQALSASDSAALAVLDGLVEPMAGAIGPLVLARVEVLGQRNAGGQKGLASVLEGQANGGARADTHRRQPRNRRERAHGLTIILLWRGVRNNGSGGHPH